jgi:hypothetical protein
MGSPCADPRGCSLSCRCTALVREGENKNVSHRGRDGRGPCRPPALHPTQPLSGCMLRYKVLYNATAFVREGHICNSHSHTQ